MKCFNHWSTTLYLSIYNKKCWKLEIVWPIFPFIQVSSKPSGSVWWVWHQRGTWVTSFYHEECATCHSAQAIWSCYICKWPGASGTRFTCGIWWAYCAHMHATWQRRLYWQDGNCVWLGSTKIWCAWLNKIAVVK